MVAAAESIDRVLHFLPHPRIVAVDNDPDQLKSIADGLNTIGLPCVTMLYSQADGLSTPACWETEHIRIVFLDLNLGEFDLQADSGKLVPSISEVLKKLSPEGPYLIVFWTKHKDIVDDVMKQLAAREKEMAFPVDFVTIDKTPFIKGKDNFDSEKLKSDIYQALATPKILLALHAWESETENAAAHTLTSLHNLVKAPQDSGRAMRDIDLENLLKNLGKAAWGLKQAKENPSGAITSGLAPIFLDQLDRRTNEPEYKRIWKEAIKTNWKSDLPGTVSRARLNAHCLIDSNCNGQTRGCWLEFTRRSYRRTTLWRDYFGCDDIKLRNEFINPGSGSDATKILKSVRLGLVECTAACDYVNNKAPLLRYILAARIPIDKLNHVEWQEPVKRPHKHDAIHRIEVISCVDGEFGLYLDFKYVLHLPAAHKLIHKENATPLFRIRKQVLADVTAKYAAHTTRPGIYSFSWRP